ncbi:hypothetical protein AB1K91_09580 [Terribacillus sp. 179-K 1B1 HS]|uniref:hypothetical protein n=1 Tax=Terribacillus sp. 179-K 1B1 HS TaxID=3142388 RepID=UPI0039A2C2D4
MNELTIDNSIASNIFIGVMLVLIAAIVIALIAIRKKKRDEEQGHPQSKYNSQSKDKESAGNPTIHTPLMGADFESDGNNKRYHDTDLSSQSYDSGPSSPSYDGGGSDGGGGGGGE